MKKTKKLMLNVILFALLIAIVACLTVGTYAWFTDQKSYSTNELRFGTIKLDVSGDSISSSDLNVVVTRSVGELTGKLMPGDTVSLKFNVALDSTSEPTYYLVYLTGAENLFDESGCFYKSGDGTDATIVYPTSESKTVGALSTTAHTFNLTKQISTSYETQGESVSITLEIYAIQQANLTQDEAYDELYKRYYTTNGVQFSSFSVSNLGISFGKGPTSLGFYKTSDFEALNDFASYSVDSTCTTAMNSSLVGEAVNYDLVKVYKTSTAVAVVSDTTIFAPESCNHLFMMSGLETFHFDNFNTSRTTNMEGMFRNCGNSGTLDLSSFDTSNVTNMSYMFNSCKFTSVTLSNFETSKVTNMNSMFTGSSFTELDLSNFNVCNLESVAAMFAYSSNLKKVYFPTYGVGGLKDLTDLFTSCYKLEEVVWNGFDASGVERMLGMFMYCSSLENIDLSSFNTSNVTSMKGMFTNCTSLTEISVGDGWVVSGDCDTTDMFNNCGVSSVTKK